LIGLGQIATLVRFLAGAKIHESGRRVKGAAQPNRDSDARRGDLEAVTASWIIGSEKDGEDVPAFVELEWRSPA
jgi:hypothetical protein